jgi:hypothetical protein
VFRSLEPALLTQVAAPLARRAPLLAEDGQRRHIHWARAISEEKMEQDEIVPILKPYPFCGDRPQIVRTGIFIVQCADCAASGPPAPNMERAAVRWNKRKGDGFG